MRNVDIDLQIKWSEEDKAFIGTCKEFPGLSVFGVTRISCANEFDVVIPMFLKLKKKCDKETYAKLRQENTKLTNSLDEMEDRYDKLRSAYRDLVGHHNQFCTCDIIY